MILVFHKLIDMGQDIQEWASKICERKSLKDLK